MCTSRDESIVLDNFNRLLECTFVPFKLKSKNGKTVRAIVPWFGEEGIIISVKYKNESRGIRIGCGRAFPTAVGVDIQSGEKNMYIKVMNNNLHLCGALSWETGLNAFYSMIDFIEMINTKWKNFRSLNYESQLQTINWILYN